MLPDVLWINEILRINSRIEGVNELESGYSQLAEIRGLASEKETIIRIKS